MTTTQKNSPVSVKSSLGNDKLLLVDAQWNEQLGQPFQAEINLCSDDAHIDLAALLKQPLSIQIDQSGNSKVWFHGFINRIESLGPIKRLYRYRASLTPSIGLLNHTGGCRIFQDHTSIDIIKKLFSEHQFSGQIEVRTTQTFASRKYCVQYGESNSQFLHRLMEEEGIYYFFEYSESKHTLVLADDLSGHKSSDHHATIAYREIIPPSLDNYLSEFKSAKEFGSGSVVLNDYDFEKPKSPLLVKQNSPVRKSEFEWFDFPGRYTESDQGQRLARIRMESQDAARSWVQMQGNCRGLRAGHLFHLKDHPDDDANIQYLITSTSISITAPSLQSGESGDFQCNSTITCQPTKIPFRSQLQTVRPIMRGPHVATVCGKKGEEIWTDRYGRIKVQFPWDREGKGDENSSCWIRVSQTSTGKNWGAMSLPRIGDEVIVEFLDGNPDCPIVTGRVYNADRMPPESLSTSQAKTVFRTRSTKGADATAFHELTFDDTKDKESIYFRSERDFKRVVENNDSLQVGYEKKSPGDQKIEIYNDQTVVIGQGSSSGSCSWTIQKNHTVEIVQGNQTNTVSQGNYTNKIAAGSATINAAKSITLICGSSKIELTPSSIQISSPSITLKADGSFQASGATMSVKADGSLDLSGGMSNLKASGILGVKGALVQIN